MNELNKCKDDSMQQERNHSEKLQQREKQEIDYLRQQKQTIDSLYYESNVIKSRSINNYKALKKSKSTSNE